MGKWQIFINYEVDTVNTKLNDVMWRWLQFFGILLLALEYNITNSGCRSELEVVVKDASVILSFLFNLSYSKIFNNYSVLQPKILHVCLKKHFVLRTCFIKSISNKLNLWI